MTEPPEDRHRPDGPEPHPHGIAEELREEIAEVVEHVPKPVRWTLGKLIWISVAAFVALIVIVIVSAVLYVANRTEWVAQEVSLLLNQTLARNSDLIVQMKDMSGNPFLGLTVAEPRVRFREGGAVLLEAPNLKITYSTWDLLFGARRSCHVEFDRPTLRLSRTADGHLRLPRWKHSGGTTGELPLRIQLQLRDASVEIEGRSDGVRHGRLDMVIETAPTRLQIVDMGWRSGPFETRLDRLRGSAVFGDSVICRIDELRGPEVALAMRAAWKQGQPDRTIHADIARIEWQLLHRITGNKDLDVTGEGRITLDLKGHDEWRGRLAASAVFDSLPGDVHGDLHWKQGQLDVSPLEALTPAGHLNGHVRWARSGWEVGGVVEHGNPSRWAAIHVPGWPAGELNGTFRYTSDSRPRGSDHLIATLAGSEIEGWAADSARVLVDFSDTAPDTFTVHMWRAGGHMTLLGRLRERGWSGVWQGSGMPLDEWPEGRSSGIRGSLAAGAGTVEQQQGRLSVTGMLSGVGTDWLGVHTAGWRLTEVSGALLPTPDLKAVVHLSNLFYLGVHFDSSQVHFHVGDGKAALERVEMRAADTTLVTAGHLEWDTGGWNVILENARATSRQFDWSADAPVQLHGDSKSVWFDRVELQDRDARLSMSGQWAQPEGGEYSWIGRGQRLDLSRLGMPPDWGLSGRMNASLEVHGRSGDARWTFDGSAIDPGLRGHHADSIHVVLAGAPATLELRVLHFSMDDGAVLGHARVDGMRREVPDTLSPQGVLEWLADGAGWQGVFTAKHMSLDRLGQLVSAAEGVGGTLSGNLTLGGRPGAPQLEARATLDSAAWHDYRVDALSLEAHYHDGNLEVPSILLTRSGVASRASGQMPLQLALGRRPDIPETPMAWTAEIANGDLGLVPVFVPQIGSASGRFALKAKLGGTARHPDLEGTVRVRDAIVRLAGREEILDNVYADLRILPERLVLDSLSARQNQRGRISGKGAVDLSGFQLKGYRFDLNMRDFTAVETGLYSAELNGDFVVTDGPRANQQTLPMVFGQMNIQRAVVLFDFANQSELQRIAAATRPLFWTYRIHMTAVQNLHWLPPNADIEFSADLNVEQTRDSLIIFGDMVSLRGNYYFLSNRFNVLKANLTFDNVGGVDPLIDAQATTRLVPGQAEPIGSRPDTEPHTITVGITGRANEPALSFEDDKKEWDESVILRELTLNRFYDPTRAPGLSSLGDPLDNYLTRAINKSLSADLSRVFGNYVTEWGVERERGGLLRGEGDLVLSAGSQISNRLSIKYSQVLPGFNRGYNTQALPTDLFERDVEAEYRINRFFFFSTELAQRRVLGGSSTNTSGVPDFNVNLKARWEY